ARLASSCTTRETRLNPAAAGPDDIKGEGSMRRPSFLGVVCAAVAALWLCSAAYAGGGATMLPIEVQAGGVASPLAGAFGNDSFAVHAFETADEGQGDDDGGDDDGLVVAVNRSLDTGPG